MKNIQFFLLTCVLTAGLFLGGTEVFVRLALDTGMQYDLEMWKYASKAKRISENPKIGHEHVPNAYVYAMGTDIQINSAGFRDRDFSYEKLADRTRILMLGDSLTFGWGVQQEDTPSKLIEAKLNKKNIDVEVINTGIGNTNTVMQVEFFMTEGYKYNPDIILLNYFINDAESIPVYNDVSFLQRYSYAYNYFNSRLDVLNRMVASDDVEADTKNSDWKSYYRGLYADTDGWIAAKKAIRKLVSFCKEKNIPLALVHYPEIRELKPYPFSDVTEKLRALAEEQNIPFIDLYTSVKELNPETLWVTVPDPHPNAVANDHFSDQLTDWLMNRLN